MLELNLELQLFSRLPWNRAWWHLWHFVIQLPNSNAFFFQIFKMKSVGRYRRSTKKSILFFLTPAILKRYYIKMTISNIIRATYGSFENASGWTMPSLNFTLSSWNSSLLSSLNSTKSSYNLTMLGSNSKMPRFNLTVNIDLL